MRKQNRYDLTGKRVRIPTLACGALIIESKSSIEIFCSFGHFNSLAQHLKHRLLLFSFAKSCPTPWTVACQAPWGSPSKNTGMCCHFLLQEIFPNQGLNPCLWHWQADSLPLSHHGSPSNIHARLLSSFSHVWLFATPWTVARQAPLSLGFSR